jgi:hypothetical protein
MIKFDNSGNVYFYREGTTDCYHFGQVARMHKEVNSYVNNLQNSKCGKCTILDSLEKTRSKNKELHLKVNSYEKAYKKFSEEIKKV